MPAQGGFLRGGVIPIAQQTTVALSGGQYTSVAAACNNILDASAAKPYVVHVGPGVYNEPPFTIPSYVTVQGEGAELVPTNNAVHFITGSPDAELVAVEIEGPTGVGAAAINYESSSLSPFKLEDVGLDGGYYGLWCHPVGSKGILYANNVIVLNSGEISENFIRVTDFGEVRGISLMYRQDNPIIHCHQGFVCDGANAYMVLDTAAFKDVGCTDVFYSNHGSYLRLSATTSSAGINCIHVGPDGASQVNAIGCTIRNTHTLDILTDTAAAVVQFSGAAHAGKLSITGGVGLTAAFSDETGGDFSGQINIGEFYVGDDTTNFTPFKSYGRATAGTGITSGGEVTRGGGLRLDVAAGVGFISIGATSGVDDVSWGGTHVDVSTGVQGWIVVDDTGLVKEVLATPDENLVIALADYVTSAGGAITFLRKRFTSLYQRPARQNVYFRDAIGPISVSGVIATKHAGVSLELDVSGGDFYLGNQLRTGALTAPISMTGWYRDAGSNWLSTPLAAIDDVNYNPVAGGLAGMTAAWFTRNLLYTAVNDSATEYHLVYGQVENIAAVGLTTNPTSPDFLTSGALRTASIIVQKSAADILSVTDERPKLGQLANPTGAVTVHNDLVGRDSLTAHIQYQLESAKGAISGYCGLTAAQKVDPANLYMTATHPVDITAGLSAEGISTEISRQDHLHFHGNLAAVDGALGALHSNAVAGVTPGFISAANQTKLDGLAITHAARHASIGADPVSPASIGAFTTAESDTRDLLRQGGLRVDPTWTDHHDGTVTVDALTAVLFADPAFGGHPEQYIVPALLLTPTNHNRSYVVADYNGGGPGIPAQKIIDDVTLINESTIIPILTIWREGNELEILTWDSIGKGLANKIHQRLVKTSRFARESGFALSELAVRRVIIEQGKAWYGAAFSIPLDYDSADIAQELVLCYHVGSVWTYSLITQYDNLQYDDGADLQPVSVGNYVVNWVYRDLAMNHDRAYILLGSGDYTDVEAHNAQPPTPPPGLVSTAILVGRIIVLQNSPTAHSISSAFETVFSGTPIQFHNDLAGLNNGDYKHFTAANYTDLTDGGETTLHAHAHGNQLGGTLHSGVVAGGASGFINGADKLKLDTLPATAPPTTLTLTAGAGLTGGGDLSANRTFNVIANADGSILANADDIQVGILATDAQHGTRNGGTLHAAVVAGVSNGFMTSADKTKLNALPATAPPTTLTLTAGTGLTGGGDLSANRTFNVIANADGSILANADDIQVGILATDAQHGVRGGGTQHADVIAAGASGFMTGADKTKLNALPATAPPTTLTLTAGAGLTGGGTLAADRTFTVGANGDGSITVNADDIQVGILATDAQHGVRGGGTQHSAAVAGVSNGFMSSSDKTKLDGLPSSVTYPVFSQTATVSVTANGVEGTVVGAGVGSVTLPANFFISGKTLGIKAFGYFTRTTGDDLRVRVYLGATAVLDTGVNSPSTVTNLGWSLEATLTCRTTGAPGTIMCQGEMRFSSSATASVYWQMVNTAASSITTTGELIVNLTGLWNGAGNTFACTNLVLTSMN